MYLSRLLVSNAQALWRFRGFVLAMVSREFHERYLGSLLGSIWSVLQPLTMILIYTIVFSRIMGMRLAGTDDRLAYSIYLCAGLLPWTFFTELLLRSQSMFIERRDFIKKVNFPRITLPVILFISTSINFVIVFVLFLIFLLLTGRFPGPVVLAFIPLILMQQAMTLGAGMFLGTLNVFFRDIGHFINVILQFWFWLTPIVYPVKVLPSWLSRFLFLNPMAAFVQAYQQIFLHGQWPVWTDFGFHFLAALVMCGLGLFVFLKLSGEMVDEL